MDCLRFRRDFVIFLYPNPHLGVVDLLIFRLQSFLFFIDMDVCSFQRLHFFKQFEACDAFKCSLVKTPVKYLLRITALSASDDSRSPPQFCKGPTRHENPFSHSHVCRTCRIMCWPLRQYLLPGFSWRLVLWPWCNHCPPAIASCTSLLSPKGLFICTLLYVIHRLLAWTTFSLDYTSSTVQYWIWYSRSMFAISSCRPS